MRWQGTTTATICYFKMGLSDARLRVSVVLYIWSLMLPLKGAMQAKTNDKLEFSVSFPKIFLFGDSLTQKGFHNGGWCIKLVEHFERKCDFLNRGFSGYTSRMSKVILPNLLQQDGNPKGSLYAATILLGSNDAVLIEEDDRAVPIDEYKENLKYIISKIEEHGIPRERIILICPPPLDIIAWKKFSEEKGYRLAHSDEKLSDYVDACLKIGDEFNMRSVNLWAEMLKNQDWRDFFFDGLHFSEKGHQFVYEKLKEHFDVILSPLKMVYPNWKDINHTSPENDLEVVLKE